LWSRGRRITSSRPSWDSVSKKKKTEIINYKWQNHRENQVRGKAREATSNINLVINKETQDCEIGTVGGNCAGEGEWRRLLWGCMVDTIHIHIWNRTKKPLGRDNGSHLTNVQYELFGIVIINLPCTMHIS
jgi:hypothetical protein